MYQKVDTDLNPVAREKEILAFWKRENVIHESFHHRDGAPRFTFYDGPPTANGRPHIGHVLTRSVKDLIPRYQTMKGKSVLRKAGWDTHGLPVELEVEKQLGLDGKPQIEAYGIEPFIGACKKSVWKYLHEWEEMSERVGFWCDMEHPYITYEDNYIESEWWSLKTIWEKGLLYQGHKIVPYCPRCGTALSSHEVAQSYKEVSDVSAFVRFPIKGRERAYLLAWTTTPWTLPSNVALCVNANVTYVEFAFRGDTCVMAKALLDSVFGADAKEIETLRELPGRELCGMEYEPLYRFDVTSGVKERGWYVVSDDYVTLSDGTGIVHIATAFGEDDNRVGRVYGLPFINLVDTQGRFVEGTPWAGAFVKDADKPILADLKERGLLLRPMPFTHNYPFCWRCDTPLLYYPRASWFIRMTQVRDALMRSNRSVHWMPDNIKEGRMGNFVENVIDWGLSRERYWGTPLPVWRCEEGHTHVVGSKKELFEMATEPLTEIELHRPFIDAVHLRCPECGKPMTRVKEVIDCWYDSGSMPFAQWHYPFENKELFESLFPAQFISEAVDQTRGWFYTLLAIGTLLFDRAPFENCLVLGHVQDKDGQKMSKHKGNVVSPWDVLDTQGADAIRWYFYSAGAPWLPSRFSMEAVTESTGRFLGTLRNTYAFFVLYADIDGFDPKAHPLESVELSLMDKWILSRLNLLVRNVDAHLENYRIPEATREMTEFVDALSNWYVRRCRERFWGKGMQKDKEAAFAALYAVLVTLAKVSAPFTPFMAEEMYRNLICSVDDSAPRSVHLCDFPACDDARVDEKLNAEMDALIEVVQLGRACRSAAAIKVRQPVPALLVQGARFSEPFAALARDELNVKEVRLVEDARAFTTYTLKPQMRTLGPRYGKLLGAIGAALRDMDGSAVVDGFARGEALVFEVNGTQVRLEKDDVLTATARRAGFFAESDGGVTAVLDVNLTPALIAEGYAREVTSKLQTMRKEAGFEVVDRIHARYDADAELCEAIAAQREVIAASTLALSLSPEKDGEDAGADVPENAVRKEWDINGKKATLTVWRA